jgi:hypothetical protein
MPVMVSESTSLPSGRVPSQKLQKTAAFETEFRRKWTKPPKKALQQRHSG